MRGLPAGRPASLSHGVPCKLFTRSAPRCIVPGTRFTVLVVRGLVICYGHILRLLDPSLFRFEPFHWETRPTGTELPPRTSSPLLGTVSRNNLQTLSSCCLSRNAFQATILRVSPTTATRAWRVSPRSRDVFQLEPQASNQTFHCVLCSSNCTDALTTESWCCFNLELIRHSFGQCGAHR